MLAHPTLEKLNAMRLTGMARAFEEQLHFDNIDALSTEERLGLMIDREMTERDARRLTNLKFPPCPALDSARNRCARTSWVCFACRISVFM